MVLVHADGVEAILLVHGHLLEMLAVDLRGPDRIEERVRVGIVGRAIEVRPGQQVERIDLHGWAQCTSPARALTGSGASAIVGATQPRSLEGDHGHHVDDRTGDGVHGSRRAGSEGRGAVRGGGPRPPDRRPPLR